MIDNNNKNLSNEDGTCHVVVCECGSDMAMVEECCGDISMTMFSYYSHGNMSIWQRIRHAIRILWTGKPYADSILMSPESATRFSGDILLVVDRAREYTAKRLANE